MSIWDLIETSDIEIPGNLAKVRVLQELAKLLDEAGTLKVLDVGCAGLQPLRFWVPLLEICSERLELIGVDIAGIKEAQAFARTKGWTNVLIKYGNGYALKRSFAAGSFDVIVATQVLEHLAHLDQFLYQLRTVLKPAGHAFLTLDSAHRSGRFNPRKPIRTLKYVVKQLLASVGNETHFDLPLYDHQVEPLFSEFGLKILDKRFYNLHPLKEIHNHRIAEHQKKKFLRRWLSIEDLLNEDKMFVESNKRYFLGLYYHLKRAS